MSNVKVGDLAIQIKSAAGNEGKIVEVLEYVGVFPFYEGFRWNENNGPCWICKYQKPASTINGRLKKIIPIPDAWLRPVSGLPDAELTFSAEKIADKLIREGVVKE